jgi:hypothetical protein
MPRFKKTAEIKVSVPRAGEFLMNIPVNVTGQTTAKSLERILLKSVQRRLRVKVLNARAVLKLK